MLHSMCSFLMPVTTDRAKGNVYQEATYDGYRKKENRIT